ncbi:hypothetical protein E3N88_20205 [Mikania micrantha]|uniref:Uncharacterized protein n=1 Tax=Mikania micrantha TaxID=192012 RepID=A0A5N6NGF6_9ASTR|nr:hypothetical protein E3N88_20205 [Mikania micrantha]
MRYKHELFRRRWKVLRDDVRPLEEGEEEEKSSGDDLRHPTGFEQARRDARSAYDRSEYWNRVHAYNDQLEVNYRYLDDQHRRMHEAWRRGEEGKRWCLTHLLLTFPQSLHMMGVSIIPCRQSTIRNGLIHKSKPHKIIRQPKIQAAVQHASLTSLNGQT